MDFNDGYAFQQLLMLLLSGALAAVVLLVTRPRRTPTLPLWARLWLELPAMALLLAATGMSCFALGFGYLLPGYVLAWTVAVALAFYWMAVWWPLRVLVLQSRLREAGLRKLTLTGAGVMVLGAVYSCFIEPQWLECEHRELRFAEVGPQPIRVAHISDIQLVDLEPRDEALVAAVNAFEPHVIVITGDYIASSIRDEVSIPAIRSILQRLRASHGIFATSGDSDSERQRLRIFKDLDVSYMLNKSATVEVEGVRVRIGCLNHAVPRWERTAGDATAEELFIVGSHWPDHAERTREILPHADLYLSGHTHGGQIQVPGFGPLLTFSDAPREVCAGGIFETANGMPMTVSRGVGMEGCYAPRFRFNCRPHVFLLTLRGPSTGRERELRR